MWKRNKQRPKSPSLIRAEKALEQTKAETPKYRELGERMRELREHNNFATAIEASFKGGRP